MRNALGMLRFAHAHPGVTRAEAAARLGMSSGSATEIMGRLRAAGLLAEVAAPSGGRGRPTTVLVPHPSGPLVAVVELTHAAWRVTTAAIGGELAPAPAHRHAGAAETVLGDIAAALRALPRERLVAVAVSVPATVRGTTVVQAATLNWRDVDLSALGLGLPLTVGNDAALAGVAEALRGAARGHPVALHLTVEVGVGGVVLIDGAPAPGAAEFGHVPFGDPALACPCGAYGCWDVTVDGRAMARSLGRPSPADPRLFADEVLAAARSGSPAERAAAGSAAAALGRGVGALLNALDPAVVTLGGLGADLLDFAGFSAGVRRAAMSWRRNALPPIVPAALGSAGPAIGAAESAFAGILEDLVARR
ncbi:ROK family transcriptional regulator [Dactylosporangium sp. CS-047395]|uniref:ROK family transcriptional regulator n=1 Tax=Dactylosporangium sp. CS-047395 TaxID=3239936 RepID=UPI003D8FDCE4